MLRRFLRLELKYLLPVRLCRKIIDSLDERMTRDEHCVSGRYAVNSLYYDTHHLRCFWARSSDGSRRTLRIRVYPSASGEPVSTGIVELKQRHHDRVEKRRIPLPLRVAERLCAGELDPATHLQLPRPDREVALEIVDLVRSPHMQPVAITAYERMAFVDDRRQPSVRVTFDTDLRGRLDALRLDQQVRTQSILGAQWSIMELKSVDSAPEWLTTMLSEYGAQPQKLSKYRLAMSRLSDGALPPRLLASAALHR